MIFDHAKQAIFDGHKVKLPEWTGYWFGDGSNIKVFTKNGDILDTPHIDKYKDRDDWMLTDGGMGFDFAFLAANSGKKIQRKGWNGAGQFAVVMPPLYLPPYNTQGTERKVNDRTAKWIGEDAPLDCQPYFALYNAQKKWQPGWLPSQGDLFAKDWQVIY